MVDAITLFNRMDLGIQMLVDFYIFTCKSLNINNYDASILRH